MAMTLKIPGSQVGVLHKSNTLNPLAAGRFISRLFIRLVIFITPTLARHASSSRVEFDAGKVQKLQSAPPVVGNLTHVLAVISKWRGCEWPPCCVCYCPPAGSKHCGLSAIFHRDFGNCAAKHSENRVTRLENGWFQCVIRWLG